MVATASFLGATMGLFVQLYSNGVRKLPLMRHPWEHVLAMGLGSAFGNAVVKWEEHLQVSLDKLMEDAQSANRKRYLGVTLAYLIIIQALGSNSAGNCGSREMFRISTAGFPLAPSFQDFVLGGQVAEGVLMWSVRV